MSLTKEQIAAYADGELSGDELAAVEAAIADDERLTEEIAAHRALKAQLGGHFAPVLDQPVPDHLAAMLKVAGTDDEAPSKAEDNVVSFGVERQKRGLAPTIRRWAPIAGPALAAALVAAIFLPNIGDGTAPEGYANEQLANALENQLVAEQSGQATTRILLSFENQTGQLCRTYRSAQAGGIACRDVTGWKIETELGLEGAQSTEYRQAGSEADLMQAAQDMAVGAALNTEEEAAAKERGWTN